MVNYTLKHLQCSQSMVKQEYHRSSSPDVFFKKGVLRNFAKFTGKHLRQSLYFNKGLQLY